jgi:hypothetical protein
MAEGTTLLSFELAIWATKQKWPGGPAFCASCPGRDLHSGRILQAQPTEEQIRKRAFELWEQRANPKDAKTSSGTKRRGNCRAQKSVVGQTKVPTFSSVVALPCTTPVLRFRGQPSGSMLRRLH